VYALSRDQRAFKIKCNSHVLTLANGLEKSPSGSQEDEIESCARVMGAVGLARKLRRGRGTVVSGPRISPFSPCAVMTIPSGLWQWKLAGPPSPRPGVRPSQSGGAIPSMVGGTPGVLPFMAFAMDQDKRRDSSISKRLRTTAQVV
ncbi:RxLR effector protein 17, partial [Dissostichus eleginoides]